MQLPVADINAQNYMMSQGQARQPTSSATPQAGSRRTKSSSTAGCSRARRGPLKSAQQAPAHGAHPSTGPCGRFFVRAGTVYAFTAGGPGRLHHDAAPGIGFSPELFMLHFLPRRTLLSSLAALGLSSLCGLTAQAATLADIQAHKVLNVGIQTDYPPYGYIDASMKPQGSDVATAELIAKQLGVKLNIVTVTSPARIPALQAGKVDLIISSMGKNPEREKVVDFTISYAPFFSGLYANKSLAIKQFGDLAGKTVSVTRGSLRTMR
jgi:hypothetical protein